MDKIIYSEVNDEYEFTVDYGASRKPHYRYLRASELDTVIVPTLEMLRDYIVGEVEKLDVLKRMDELGVIKLTEKLTVKFCKAFAPTKNYGLDKPAIRLIVMDILKQLIDGKVERFTFPYIPDQGQSQIASDVEEAGAE